MEPPTDTPSSTPFWLLVWWTLSLPVTVVLCGQSILAAPQPTPQEQEEESLHSIFQLITRRIRTTSTNTSMNLRYRTEMAQEAKEALESLRWSDLLSFEPWVLVPNGSLAGFFDWVPREYRVGPWTVSSLAYLTVLWYSVALIAGYLCSPAAGRWWTETDLASLRYPDVLSDEWNYNLAATVWMFFIMVLIYHGPNSYRAWGTYTTQAWTLLWVRHILALLAPLSTTATLWAEYLRFPVAVSATVTFFTWNFVIFPFIYFVGMKTPETKKAFVNFALKFRMVQIHLFNIVFIGLHLYWASPPRRLEAVDFYFSIVSIVLFQFWYFGICDRLGVHVYPPFSPRNRNVLLVWNGMLVLYFVVYLGWQHLMTELLTLQQGAHHADGFVGGNVTTTFVASLFS